MRHRGTVLGVFVLGVLAVVAFWTRGSVGHAAHGHGAALQTVDLAGFLTLGLLGGFGHCAAMCSPFVLFVSRRYARTASPLEAQAWYTTGRIVTYAVLGAVAGAAGAGIEQAGALLGVRRAAAVVAGAVLLAWAIAALSGSTASEAVSGPFGRIAGRLKGRVPGHPFATGLFLGLLPCGLLYSAVIAAVARGGALEGAAALTAFGLGTAPAMLGLSLADELLAHRRALVNRLSQVFILIMGCRLLWMALF